MPLEDTFAIIKPDAFGKPWLEYVMQKNEEEEPPADDGDEDRPPRDPFNRVAQVRAADMGEEILKRIAKAGFEVVQRKTMKLTAQVCVRVLGTWRVCRSCERRRASA
jgi:hypothetical protein